MLTQSQSNAVFQNIPTSYTVDGTDYTATKEYRDRWDGIIDIPAIMLHYTHRTSQVVQAIGWDAEWDYDRLEVSVFAQTDTIHGIHGLNIAEQIVSTLELWFKQTAEGLLQSSGLKIMRTHPVQDRSYLEEKIYRIHFEVDLLYKLI